jgi:septum formation protein
MLVLASGSASRARMLKAAGVAFTIDPADIDEDAAKTPGFAPDKIAALLADQKALAVSARRPGDLVLGADQVLVFEDRLISKCRDMAEAKALLLALSGKEHDLISAASLAREGMVIWRALDRVRLSMRPLRESFIDSYLAGEGEGLLSGVGCYRMEGRGAQLFASVQGDFFSILGLPLLPVLAALREQGMLAV